MAPHRTSSPSAKATVTATRSAPIRSARATQRATTRPATPSFCRTRQRLCPSPDHELLLHNVRLAKVRQALLDTNRIERKAFREHARVENAAAAYARELAALLDERGFTRDVHISAPPPAARRS